MEWTIFDSTDSRIILVMKVAFNNFDDDVDNDLSLIFYTTCERERDQGEEKLGYISTYLSL